MTDRITPEFYWSEAERLLHLAMSTRDPATRADLLQMVAHFRQMAAHLHGDHAAAANANHSGREDSESA